MPWASWAAMCLLDSPKHQLPSQGLLSCWCAVSHVSDVTSPRHWSLEMDLMSLCFLQLRKTSKKLMLKHPEEPAGLSAAATVPTGGQRAAQCSKAGWSAPKAEHQTSRGQHITGTEGCLSTLHISTYHPPHGTWQVMSCNASQCPGKDDSTVVAPCPHSEDPAASLRASTQEVWPLLLMFSHSQTHMLDPSPQTSILGRPAVFVTQVTSGM